MTEPAIRVLIVDDDAPARARLRALLEDERDVVLVGECTGGREAVMRLAREDVDLVFLDVQMPDLDGFAVLTEIDAERLPAVVFVSAFSEFAVRAFEAYALDYLLKPFDDIRFARTMARAREQTAARRASTDVDPRLAALIEHASMPLKQPYPESIAIRNGGQYEVLRVANIDWIAADGNYARVFVNHRGRLLTQTLATLEREVLDPDVFVRVHRSAIVNITRIASLKSQESGGLTLTLADGTEVECSRRFRRKLDGRMYFTT